jgi:DNA topoisomerase IA
VIGLKKIIIVESPSKSKTIESYMGEDFKVVASNGHIRDLSTKGKGGLGIDIPSGFIPRYEVLKEKVIQPVIEPVAPVALEVVAEETTVVETAAVVESEVKDQEAPKKKRTAKKKKAATEE